MAKPTVNLQNLSTEADQALNNFVAGEIDKEHIEQRELDKKADSADSNKRAIRAKENHDIKLTADLEERGEVLSTGRPSGKKARPAVNPDPKYVYKNYPVKEIDGIRVLFLGARPFWDKQCEWDNGYQDQYEHFTQSEHPMFYNAVYCKVKYVDHYKRVIDAWVVNTDQEKMLFIKQP